MTHPDLAICTTAAWQTKHLTSDEAADLTGGTIQ